MKKENITIALLVTVLIVLSFCLYKLFTPGEQISNAKLEKEIADLKASNEVLREDVATILLNISEHNSNFDFILKDVATVQKSIEQNKKGSTTIINRYHEIPTIVNRYNRSELSRKFAEFQ